MLVLIRHGESTANAENRKAGQSNVPLSDKGIKQCKETASELRGYSFDAVFTSDLVRCLDTTRLIVNIPEEQWIIVEELRERSGGVFEGMTYPDIRKMLPPKKYKLWQRDYFEAPQMGESMKDVEERVIPYAKKHIFPLVNERKNVLIVTHEVVMKVLIGHIKQLSETEIPKLPHVENAMPYFYYGKVRI